MKIYARELLLTTGLLGLIVSGIAVGAQVTSIDEVTFEETSESSNTEYTDNDNVNTTAESTFETISTENVSMPINASLDSIDIIFKPNNNNSESDESWRNTTDSSRTEQLWNSSRISNSSTSTELDENVSENSDNSTSTDNEDTNADVTTGAEFSQSDENGTIGTTDSESDEANSTSLENNNSNITNYSYTETNEQSSNSETGNASTEVPSVTEGMTGNIELRTTEENFTSFNDAFSSSPESTTIIKTPVESGNFSLIPQNPATNTTSSTAHASDPKITSDKASKVNGVTIAAILFIVVGIMIIVVLVVVASHTKRKYERLYEEMLPIVRFEP